MIQYNIYIEIVALIPYQSVCAINLYIFSYFSSMYRMKQSRAEQKYGKAIDDLEKEPFRNETSKNQWLEESSDDEDKDTLFDINFLKNSRTNAAHV